MHVHLLVVLVEDIDRGRAGLLLADQSDHVVVDAARGRGVAISFEGADLDVVVPFPLIDVEVVGVQLLASRPAPSRARACSCAHVYIVYMLHDTCAHGLGR